LQEQEGEQLKRHLKNLEFEESEFLKLYRHPKIQFNRLTTIPNANYIEHSLIDSKNNYRQLKSSFIEEVLKKHQYHYMPTYNSLRDIFMTIRRKYTKCIFYSGLYRIFLFKCYSASSLSLSLSLSMLTARLSSKWKSLQ